MERITVAWMGGAVWFVLIMPGAVLNGFGSTMQASQTVFGIIAALPALGAMFSIPVGWLVDASGERKKIFLISHLAQRLLTFPLVLLPWWFGIHSPIALPVFLAVLFLIWLMQQFGGAAWIGWMSDLVPHRIRGRYFARRRQWGILTTIPTAILAAWLMDRAGMSGTDQIVMVCIGVYAVGTLFGLMDILLFAAIPHVAPPKRTPVPLATRLALPFRDRDFMSYSWYVGLHNFTWLPMSMFTMRYFKEYVGVSALVMQLCMIVVPMLAVLVVLPVWGRAVDTHGRRPLFGLSTLALIPISVLWCFVTRDTIWLGYVLAAAATCAWAAVEVTNLNQVMRYSGTARSGPQLGAGYIAVNSLLFSVLGLIGSYLAGAFLDRWSIASPTHESAPAGWNGYHILFLSLAVIRVGQLLVLPRLKEPGASSLFHAGRSIAGDLLDTARFAIMHPINWLRRRADPEVNEEA